MTQAEFNDYRLSLMYYFGEKTWNMVQKMRTGEFYHNDLYCLVLTRKWISIMNEYVLIAEADIANDRNFYTQDEMYKLSQKLNIYLNLNYDLNFYLTI